MVQEGIKSKNQEVTKMTKYRSPAAQAASLIRKELKQEFPGMKYSVRSCNYAGGCSIDINVQEQPKKVVAKVRDIASKYKLGSFNAMEDIYEFTNRNDNLPQVNYVFVNNIIGSL